MDNLSNVNSLDKADTTAEPQAPESSDTATPCGVAAAPNDRVDRITEHIDQALQQANPVVATIGAASGDLLLLHYRLGQALNERLADGPDLLASLSEIIPTLSIYAKIGQQADRFTQLALKIQMAQRDLAEANATVPSAPRRKRPPR